MVDRPAVDPARYLALVERAYEAQWARELDPELRAELSVCGDALMAVDDPRGVLIALDLAGLVTEKRRHIDANRARLLGSAAGAPHETAWHMGALVGATVVLAATTEPLDRLLAAPCAATLRRLCVRMEPQGDRRADGQLRRAVFTRLAGARPAPPLEELELVVPRQARRPPPQPPPPLLRAYPRLYLLAVGRGTVALPLDGDLPDHVRTGRELTSRNLTLHNAAYRRVGKAPRFARAVELAIRYGFSASR
jgi:hypothetical protein